jgi:hypothetical protein
VTMGLHAKTLKATLSELPPVVHRYDDVNGV